LKPVQVSEPASAELAAAVRWYEDRRPGWGQRLFDAITDAVVVIESHPEAGSPRPTQQAVRQLKVRGFPYVIVYRIRPAHSHVIAIAHTSRRPQYWRQRSQ